MFLATLSLPWIKWVCATIEQSHRVSQLSVEQLKHEMVFHLRIVSDGPVTLYGYYFPTLDISSTTLVAHYLQHLFVFMAASLSAHFFFLVKWRLFLPMIGAALFLSVGIDIPLTLIGSIEGLILENLAPDQLQSSYWVKMERALNMGGRMGLAIGLCLLCLAISHRPLKKKR